MIIMIKRWRFLLMPLHCNALFLLRTHTVDTGLNRFSQSVCLLLILGRQMITATWRWLCLPGLSQTNTKRASVTSTPPSPVYLVLLPLLFAFPTRSVPVHACKFRTLSPALPLFSSSQHLSSPLPEVSGGLSGPLVWMTDKALSPQSSENGYLQLFWIRQK